MPLGSVPNDRLRHTLIGYNRFVNSGARWAVRMNDQETRCAMALAVKGARHDDHSDLGRQGLVLIATYRPRRATVSWYRDTK